MFTIKLYGHDGSRLRILTAHSFTILRYPNGSEITLHQKGSAAFEDSRYDIKEAWPEAQTSDEALNQVPERYGKAIIENELGRTTEIIDLPASLSPPVPRAARRFIGSEFDAERHRPGPNRY